MKPKCIITGASGLLGHAVHARMSPEYDVVGISYTNTIRGTRSRDIRDRAQLQGLLEAEKPDVVVHCAAYRDPDFCEKDPDEARRLNVLPAQVMAESLPRGVPLIFISSDYVFDGESPPYTEESPPSAINVYGQTKIEAERAILQCEGGVVIRCPLLIGPGPEQVCTGFVAQLIEAAHSNEKLLLDNVLIRFPTYNFDVAEAILFLLARKARGIFHVSGARGGTRYTWTMETASLLECPTNHLKSSNTVVSRGAKRPRDSQLGTGKIRAMGYDHFTDFADVVSRYT